MASASRRSRRVARRQAGVISQGLNREPDFRVMLLCNAGVGQRRRYPSFEGDRGAEGVGSPSKPGMRHAASLSQIPPQLDGGWPGSASRSPRPHEVYTAAVAELAEADALRTPPPKLKSAADCGSGAAPGGGGGSAPGSRPGSPLRRARSNLAPGSLSPILCHSAPVSPKTSILVNGGAAKHMLFKEHTCSSLRPSDDASASAGGATACADRVPHSRRAFSMPGSQQLQLLAMHQAAEQQVQQLAQQQQQQAQHGGGCGGGGGGGQVSSLAARVPAFSCPPLDVSGQPEGSGASPGVGALGLFDVPTPDSLSPNSGCTVASIESPHQPTASRFAPEGRAGSLSAAAAATAAAASHSLRPRPPGSTGSGGGGSSSSTPHSCGALSGAGGAPLPHPLQLTRKLSTKSSAICMPLLPESSSSAVAALPGCGSPVPTVPGDGTPGGSFRRRRSYNRVPALAGLHMAHLVPGSDCSSPNSPTAAVALGGGPSGGPPLRGGALQLQLQHQGGGGAFGSSGLSSCSTAFTVGSAGSVGTSCAAEDGSALGPGPGQLQQALAGCGLVGGGVPYGSLPANRPSSARSRAVLTLVEAVRSKDEATLGSKLEYLAGPSGAVAGINDRHPLTGRTALAEATQLNSLPMARRLLACGASPRVAHATAGPPLLQAAACGRRP
ncbi:hypothetical protein MNEG_11250 [Monoraphidium neglectum]|uniref:Uncharacterized protein n=1 Tax=Monoraphidium neglectum TaxID=145388 RepID=A0A0D2M679_9CHLO|nr:hypothetical protein MNEG_11250 [Monoraphidium neglectum]KIY96711.1 hypothetical protein MNEG_11250 [Monoraphidium neglectum]|eukprot:XP_013895731.1 hypothetical protein MNEG_11250 [Monoraphidium neglectum]